MGKSISALLSALSAHVRTLFRGRKLERGYAVCMSSWFNERQAGVLGQRGYTFRSHRLKV